MSTFGEIVYSVLDLLKECSDDAYYTEEHIMFLAGKMRAMLLERKYKGSRNSPYSKMSEENKQQICLTVSRASLLPAGCDGMWLRSDAEIPDMLDVMDSVTCTGHDLIPTVVTFIPAERMPYVGHNKWLRNFIYAAKSMDGHLYLRGSNPQFLYLSRVGLTGVFADVEAAARLSHRACENGGICDILSEPFPLESSLVPVCIDLIVQELTGARFMPEDKKNDARDGLADIGMQARLGTPVSNAVRKKGDSAEQETE